MIQVQIDGNPFGADLGGMHCIGDVLEFVKANIDPDSIITAVGFNGDPLSENDWSLPLSAHRGRVLEVKTGAKTNYISERISLAPEILKNIIEQLKTTSADYRMGQSASGNTKLAGAVEDLNAFVSWYNSLLSMDPIGLGNRQRDFVTHVNAIKTVCEQIVQQQLYNSWWVLSETINTRLNPKLEEVKGFCEGNNQLFAQPSL